MALKEGHVQVGVNTSQLELYSVKESCKRQIQSVLLYRKH